MKRKVRIKINGDLLHDLVKHENQTDLANGFGLSKQAFFNIYQDNKIHPRMLLELSNKFEWGEKTVGALIVQKQEMPTSMHIELGY